MTQAERQQAKTRDYLGKGKFEDAPENQMILYCGTETKTPGEVTIVMPTHNRGVELVAKSITSVLDQTWKEFQFIILDNGTDPVISKEIYDYVTSLDDERILLYKNRESVPLFANFNRCFSLARTTWVMMVHDDDCLAPNHLQIMLQAINQIPDCDGICCAHQVVDLRKEKEEDSEVSAAPSEIKVEQVQILDYLHCFCRLLLGAVLKKSAFVEVGGFATGKSLIEDYVTMARLAYHYKLYYIPEKLYRYYWFENLSLQSKWQDEMVWEHYLRRTVASKLPLLTRPIFKKCVKIDTKRIVEIYESDKSIFGKPYYFDHRLFCKDCGMRTLKIWKITEKIVEGAAWRLEKILKRGRKQYVFSLATVEDGETME